MHAASEVEVRRTRSSRPPRLGLAACSVLALASLGSDCLSSGADSVDGGFVGAGAPSVEVTVDGTHVGPAPALTGSYADLTTARDGLQRVTTADLVIHAVAANASCDLHFDRFGPNVTAFAAGMTTLQAPLSNATADGTTAWVGALTVVAGQLTLQCFGSSCDGGILSISILDATHVEGFVSATFADPNDGQTSDTVCSFYVPWRTYAP